MDRFADRRFTGGYVPLADVALPAAIFARQNKALSSPTFDRITPRLLRWVADARGHVIAADPVEPIAGFYAPVHRALTEPILLGGAPRTVAIANGTLAAAVGLGLQLWIPGVVLWIIGHSLAVWGARVDPQFMQVFARHIKHKPLLDV